MFARHRCAFINVLIAQFAFPTVGAVAVKVVRLIGLRAFTIPAREARTLINIDFAVAYDAAVSWQALAGIVVQLLRTDTTVLTRT